jgi:hypothetical protein
MATIRPPPSYACATRRSSLREIAGRLVIRTGKTRGEYPSPATVMRMLREHDEQAAAVESA